MTTGTLILLTVVSAAICVGIAVLAPLEDLGLQASTFFGFAVASLVLGLLGAALDVIPIFAIVVGPGAAAGVLIKAYLGHQDEARSTHLRETRRFTCRNVHCTRFGQPTATPACAGCDHPTT